MKSISDTHVHADTSLINLSLLTFSFLFSNSSARSDIVLQVKVQDNESLERALRRFKRKIQRSGLYSELRKRRFYEKPSAQRKRKREAAIRRERRRQRRTPVQL